MESLDSEWDTPRNEVFLASDASQNGPDNMRGDFREEEVRAVGQVQEGERVRCVWSWSHRATVSALCAADLDSETDNEPRVDLPDGSERLWFVNRAVPAHMTESELLSGLEVRRRHQHPLLLLRQHVSDAVLHRSTQQWTSLVGARSTRWHSVEISYVSLQWVPSELNAADAASRLFD